MLCIVKRAMLLMCCIMLCHSFLYCAVTRLDTDSTAPGKRVAVGGFAQPKRKKADTHSLIAFYILSLFIE